MPGGRHCGLRSRGEHSRGEHSRGEHSRGEHSRGEHSRGELRAGMNDLLKRSGSLEPGSVAAAAMGPPGYDAGNLRECWRFYASV